MPKALTTTSHALLGLLSIRPWSTYELAKQVERSLGWFWPRTERKIYDEAKHLVTAGLATAAEEPTGSRPRTVYSITPAGTAALRSWLGEPSAPMKLEAEALVRVFFADAGTVDQLRATIDELASSARADVDRLLELFAATEDPEYAFAGRRHVNAVAIRFQLDHRRMVAEWAEWASAQIDRWPAADDPGDWDWRTALDVD